jgi:dynein light chain LC8-type
MTDRKAVIKNADMSEDMQQDAGQCLARSIDKKDVFLFLVDIATQALEKYNIEKDIAAYIKKEFDKKYNPTWHWYVNEAFQSRLMLIFVFSALLAATSARMSLTKQSTLSISTWVKWLFYSSNQVKWTNIGDERTSILGRFSL